VWGFSFGWWFAVLLAQHYSERFAHGIVRQLAGRCLDIFTKKKVIGLQN
jgi:hypothetical protein